MTLLMDALTGARRPWDVRILPMDGPGEPWWWNAWHEATATERSGRAATRAAAEAAMAAAIRDADAVLATVVLGMREMTENPLSSIALRLTVRPPAHSRGPGPHRTRPFGLRFARSVPVAERPAVRYCHELQVAVTEHGVPLVESGKDDKAKEWESKTYSDGDEGQEEECWGWEEQ